MFTAPFWVDAGERALRTFAQALVSVFVAGVTILSVPWADALAVAATAALVSVLTSVASVDLGQRGTASAVDYTGRHRLEE